jgi:hypothetical protein
MSANSTENIAETKILHEAILSGLFLFIVAEPEILLLNLTC